MDSRLRALLVGALVIAVSLIVLAPLSARAEQAMQPVSTVILKGYAGSDSAGIQDFKAGLIAFYNYAIPPAKVGTPPPGSVAYEMPSTYYDVLLNPVKYVESPTGQVMINPFYYQSVRFAINYILDREYFVQSILNGYGIPTLTAYGGEYEMLTTSNVTAQFANITYNPSYANETIYKTLTAHGFQYINGKWYYNGSPVTIYVFVRTDTTARYLYATFLISQLEDLGFTVVPIYGDLLKQITMVYGMPPNETSWNVLVEAWGGTYGYYDWGLPASFYGAFFGNLPASDAYGTAWGIWNTTSIQEPQLTQELNIIDNLSVILAYSNFTSAEQYYKYVNIITYYGIVTAIRLGLAQGLVPIFVNSQMAQGLIPNFIEGLVTPFSYLTAKAPNGQLIIGVRHLARGSMNPVAGWVDAYSVATASGVFLPIEYSIPGNGYPVPVGITYKLVNISVNASIPVPTSALVFNATSMQVEHVPPGTYAKVDVIVNFAPLMQHDRFVDGQPITLADIIEQYLLTCNVSLNPSSPIYDPEAAAVYAPDVQLILGFRIINSTAIEIWSNNWWFDPTVAALGTIADFIGPLGYAEPGGGMMPWPLYVAMSQVVAHGLAAWSRGVASEEQVHWLDLVNPTDVGNILKFLQQDAASAYIPAGLLQVQQLSGVQLVNSTFATQAYQDAINYINTYGNAVIGEGPFMLVSYQPPQYAKLVRNPYFNVSIPSILAVPPIIYSVHLNLPLLGMVPAGGTLTGTVYGTVDGTNQTSTQSGVFVIAQFVSPEGAVLAQENVTSGADGSFTLTVPKSLTPGSYYVVLYAYTPDNILLNPAKYTITVTPVTTTTTTTTTPTTTTTTTTTSLPTVPTISITSSIATTTTTTTTTTPIITTTTTTPVKPPSVSTTLVVTAVVVVIVIIAAVALLARRK
ncbi:MAG: ABC transporter substrate-binding protein [Acidilobus sp.]|nr:ABC transporter substrate-binding protein [Acidilobus sp.]